MHGMAHVARKRLQPVSLISIIGIGDVLCDVDNLSKRSMYYQ